MKTKTLFLLVLFTFAAATQAADPLRVFIRGGVKTHGPNQHDHPRFMREWTELLENRGIDATGSMDFPTQEQLQETDVLVIYAADGMKIVGEQRAYFEDYLRRGGGLVVIHDGVVSGDQHRWAKKVQGGAWVWNDPENPDLKTKWYEGKVGLYFVDTQHPITQGISNYDWKDEIYYDLDMSNDVRVLATSFHSVFVIAPQLWTYENTWEGGAKPYRAFVSLPGHEYDVFETSHYRSILLRGIAWAGQRENVDEFCTEKELASLTYPEGGPTPPDQAAEKLYLHPEFNLNLVTSEPLVEKVISLDWARDGTLWVAETPEYPGGRTINPNDLPTKPYRTLHPEKFESRKEEPRTPQDRISWLKDTDKDGIMDKKHVFADGLELVTSLVFYKDGVIVAQAPHILWLRDRNGDGVCDMKEGSEMVTLYTGFGTFDTHAVINNFRWGLDGWVYGAVGYSAGHPKSPDGSKDFGRITAGVIRFKPDGSAFEQYASGSCNTWGFDFGPDGEAFYTTATCGEHFLHVVMPESILARGNVGDVRASHVVPDHQEIAPALQHTRPAYVQIDWVGRFTAAAGCAIYNGGAWPERFNGSHFTSETTMHLVHHEFLKPDGSTYIASKEPGREDTEFVAGTDLWFRPVHTRVGPDGALYVVDFYNQAAIHNDTRGPKHGARNAATRPDRDHHFARIWRIQHKNAETIQQPDLQGGNPAVLVQALKSPNGWVRNTAARLLRESGDGNQTEALQNLATDRSLPGFSRIAALYTLHCLEKLNASFLANLINDNDPAVRKNALRIAYERKEESETVKRAALQHLNDDNARAQINALIALGNFEATDEIAEAIIQVWPDLQDKYLQSAAVGVVANHPMRFIEAAFRVREPKSMVGFIPHAVRLLGIKQDPREASRLIILLGQNPSSTDELKKIALETLASVLKADVAPNWSEPIKEAFAEMLASEHPGLPGAVLPLIARGENASSLADSLRPVITELENKLRNARLTDEERGQIAVNLLGVKNLDPEIIQNVAELLNPSNSMNLQKQIVQALGNSGGEASGKALINAFNEVALEVRNEIFDALIKRTNWTQSLLSTLEDREIDLLVLGPGNIFRLRTHPDEQVAGRARKVIDSLRGPEQQEKEELIAQFLPAVQKTGDIQTGKEIYTVNCGVCHVYKGEGRNLAPDLTGMGAHGPEDLLVHIIDPNRLVEPNFITTSIETKDGLAYDGIIERENNVELVLRNAGGDYTLRKSEIAKRTSTGRSLMPEGFEALGTQGLRDLMTYLVADANQYRIVDLTEAFTANTSEGIYASGESNGGTIQFERFGIIKVSDIPFEVVSPDRSLTGKNILVLKGGSGYAKTYPQQVEFETGFAATKLHFLGGIGGWAYPFGGEDLKNKAVAKVTLHFENGKTQELVLRNAVEFADYIGSGPNYDVPGSERVPDLVKRGQVRWFSKVVEQQSVIERISIQSYNNEIAPTFIAITAELLDSAQVDEQAAATGSHQ